MLSYKTREKISIALMILAGILVAAIIIGLVYSQYQTCREDGYSFTECNAIYSGRGFILHPR